MIEKVKALVEKNRNAKSESEKKRIEQETEELITQDPEAWAEAMTSCMKETKQELKNVLIREQLEEISKFISISYLAKEYFKKTPQWFYQRMNGNLVNGKPVQFTIEEIDTLNFALQEMSKKIGSVRVAV